MFSVIYHQSISAGKGLSGASARFTPGPGEREEGWMKHYAGDRTIDGVKVTVHETKSFNHSTNLE